MKRLFFSIILAAWGFGAFAQGVSEIKSPDSVMVQYRINPGDMPMTIAQKYRVSILDLLKWNNMDLDSRIIVGQRLKIKVKAVPIQLTASKEAKPMQTPPKEKNEEWVSVNSYQVLWEESLEEIAQKINLSAADLAAWNNLNDPKALQSVGTILVLKGKITVYKAVFGETLESIARRFNLEPAILAAWNNKPMGYGVGFDGENFQLLGEEKKAEPQIAELTPNQEKKKEEPPKTAVTTEKKAEKVEGTIEKLSYVSRKGDNLNMIAYLFGVDVLELRTWNNIASGVYDLKEGTQLTIKRPMRSKEVPHE
jgi:LysM repeat protein